MIARDLKTDPATGELALVDGDLAMVFGIDSIRQDVAERLAYVRGDWFLDPEDPEAVPLFESVLGSRPNQETIAGVYRKVILATPGVTGIQTLTIEIDRRARTAAITFRADTDYGALEASLPVTVGGG
jgi:hypothetical protein